MYNVDDCRSLRKASTFNSFHSLLETVVLARDFTGCEKELWCNERLVGENRRINVDRNYYVGARHDDIQRVFRAVCGTVHELKPACSAQNVEETDRWRGRWSSKCKFRSPAMMTGAAWTATRGTRSAKSSKKTVVAASEPGRYTTSTKYTWKIKNIVISQFFVSFNLNIYLVYPNVYLGNPMPNDYSCHSRQWWLWVAVLLKFWDFCW